MTNSNRPARQETCALCLFCSNCSGIAVQGLMSSGRARLTMCHPRHPHWTVRYKLAADCHTLLPTPTQKSRSEERPVRDVITLKYDKCH